MAEKNAPPLQSRWRLDAIAVTLLAVGGLLTVALASSRALTGEPNVFGSWGERAAGLLVEPLGWGAVALLAGWFAVAGVLVVNRRVGRVALRLAGWGVLTVVAAVGVDWFGAGLPSPAVAGRGGSVGAYLRFGLEDATQPEVAFVLFALALVGGLWLAADKLVIRCARHRRGPARAVAGRGVGERPLCRRDGEGARLGRSGGEVARPRDLRRLRLRESSAARKAVAAPPAPVPTPVLKPVKAPKVAKVVAPVSVSVDTPPPVGSPLDREAASGTEEVKVEDIPIHVHAGPKLAPMLRAAPPADEQLSNVDYELPPLSLLNDAEPFPVDDHEQKLREVAVLLEKTFLDFGLNVKVVGIHTGPVITQYEIALETGLRLNKVTTLADDLALNLQGAERAHRRAAAGPQHGRHRGAERDPPDGAAQGTRRRARGHAEGVEVQAAAVPRQGRRGPAAGIRPGRRCRTCSSPAAPAPASRCA